MQSPLSWGWRPRETTVQAKAAVAWGDVAAALHARIASMSESEQARLQATAHRHGLIVSGEESDLPWVDGIAYAAPTEQAPGLWVSTIEEPDISADLLQRAMLRRYRLEPLLLWRWPAALIPLNNLCPVSSVDWAAWSGLWRGR